MVEKLQKELQAMLGDMRAPSIRQSKNDEDTLVIGDIVKAHLPALAEALGEADTKGLPMEEKIAIWNEAQERRGSFNSIILRGNCMLDSDMAPHVNRIMEQYRKVCLDFSGVYGSAVEKLHFTENTESLVINGALDSSMYRTLAHKFYEPGCAITKFSGTGHALVDDSAKRLVEEALAANKERTANLNRAAAMHSGLKANAGIRY